MDYSHITDGLGRYIENEICNQMSGWKKAVVATAAGVAMRRLPEYMQKLPEGLTVDEILTEARKHLREPVVIDIPMIGSLSFGANDLDVVRSYIL